MKTTRFNLLSYRSIGLGFTQRKDVREQRLKNGIALQTHINAQHSGEIIPTCPACIEIQRKQKRATQK